MSTKDNAAKLMANLTTEQRNAVLALAGDDAEKQIETIANVQHTWKAPIANTAPAPNAPSPHGGVVSPMSTRETYLRMREANPFAASKYGLEHPEVYDDEHYKKGA